jgi:hypothetical protein
MIDHHFLEDDEHSQRILYNLGFSMRTRDIIPLPAPILFDSHARDRYTVMPADIMAYLAATTEVEEEAQEWDAQALP